MLATAGSPRSRRLRVVVDELRVVRDAVRVFVSGAARRSLSEQPLGSDRRRRRRPRAPTMVVPRSVSSLSSAFSLRSEYRAPVAQRAPGGSRRARASSAGSHSRAGHDGAPRAALTGTSPGQRRARLAVQDRGHGRSGRTRLAIGVLTRGPRVDPDCSQRGPRHRTFIPAPDSSPPRWCATAGRLLTNQRSCECAPAAAGDARQPARRLRPRAGSRADPGVSDSPESRYLSRRERRRSLRIRPSVWQCGQ